MGICPDCGTDLDIEEIIIGNSYYEAFCCHCSKYIRKKASADTIKMLLEVTD